MYLKTGKLIIEDVVVSNNVVPYLFVIVPLCGGMFVNKD